MRTVFRANSNSLLFREFMEIIKRKYTFVPIKMKSNQEDLGEGLKIT